MSLTIGQPAPDFTTIDHNGNEVTLSKLKGKKVVLYFYPKDNTPGCTEQACNLTDNYKALQKANYAVLGVSADSQKKHQNFVKKFDIAFPLLMDTEREIIDMYDVWQLKKFMGREFMGIVRTTFIIDENGIIEDIISKVKTKEHTAQILN